MSIKGKPPWYAEAAGPSNDSSVSIGGSSDDLNAGETFVSTVASIVNDDSLSNEEVVKALKGLLGAMEQAQNRLHRSLAEKLRENPFAAADDGESIAGDGEDDDAAEAAGKSRFRMFGIF